MKQSFVIAFLLLSFCLSGQKQHIDSINSISFDKKVVNARIYDRLFLDNARKARKISYPKGEADSYVNVGLMYYYQGKYERTLQYYLKAISIYESIGDIERQAMAYGELGYSMKRRNMSKAVNYMQRGKRLAEENGYEKPLLSIYDNYGVLKEMMGQPDSALYFYNKCLAMKERLGDSIGIPFSLNKIAGIYVLKRRFSDAKPLYDRAIRIRKNLNDKIGMAENYGFFGDFYREQEDFSKALEYYSRSLDLCRKYGYIYLAQTNYRNMAAVYESSGRPADALEHFKLYQQFKDSLLNKETNSRIAELEVQFETSKKEKLLLEKDAEVKRRNMFVLILTIVAISAALIGFLIFRQQRLINLQMSQEHSLKQAIQRIETQNQLQEQRLQISRDLHDNIGSQLTFIISSVDNIRYAFDVNSGKLGEKLSNISSFARETIVELRDTIWAMNHSEIGFDDLCARISNFIGKAREASENVKFDFKVDDSLTPVRFSSVTGINIYRTIQEAVNNALKYSEGTEINIFIRPDGTSIVINVDDNGRGFDVDRVTRGNGLLNMEKRTGDLGGKIKIESEPGSGSRIIIRLKRALLNSKNVN